MDETDENLVGVLMVDRPRRASEAWLSKVEETFGPYQLTPMTMDQDRGIVCRMRVRNDSTRYLREFPSVVSEAIADSLSPLLDQEPNPWFTVWWDENSGLWHSEFYQGGPHG